MQDSANVLYFPFIEFQSLEWLKATLLVWDHVYRIVPSGYSPNDNAEIKEAIQAGRIRNIQLERQDTQDAYQTFTDIIRNAQFVPAGLESEDVERIHRDKIDDRLYPILEQQANAFRQEEWVNVSKEFGRGYMFQLADIVASRRGLTKATSDSDAWVTSHYFSHEGNVGEMVYDASASRQLCYFNFKGVIPLSVKQCRMKDIASFSDKHRDERKLFRQRVSAFLGQLEACESESHLGDIIHDYWIDLIRAKEDFRKSMSFAGTGGLHALFTVAVPVAATVLGTIGTLTSNPALMEMAVAMGFGSVAALAENRKRREDTAKTNYGAYLLDIDEKLAKENKIYRFNYIMDQFIND
jgi:hypothetical protein